jgi:GNAT superfamily N-acetyltransferase
MVHRHFSFQRPIPHFETHTAQIYIYINIYIFHLLEISPLISAFHIFHPPTLKQKRHNAQGVEKEYPHLALARLSGLRPWRVVASPALRGRGFGQKALELLERHVRCHDLDGKRLKSPKLVEDG